MIQKKDISSAEEVDEFLLAAYLSHGLPVELRHDIERHLLQSSEARDLLGMAQDALDGISSPDFQSGNRRMSTDTKSSAGSMPTEAQDTELRDAEQRIASQRTEDRKKEKDEQRHADRAFLNMQIGVASIPVLVVVAGLLIWSLFPKTADTSQLQATQPQATQSVSAVLATMWIPTLDAAGETISWPIIKSAVRYAVIVYNPDDLTIADVATTDMSSLSGLQAMANTIGKSQPAFLSVWVMALDEKGNVIRSSDSVKLVSKRYGS